MPLPVPGLMLLSGGIDSTTLLYACQPQIPLQALFVDYGQRSARHECAAATYHADRLHIPLATLDASALGRQLNRARGRDYHVPFPQRNLWLLGVAINWALCMRHEHLYVGWNAEDATADPSTTAAHLARWRALSLDAIEVRAPFLNLTKVEILQRGQILGVDYARTYSCLRGRTVPCGRCPQCTACAQAQAVLRTPGTPL